MKFKTDINCGGCVASVTPLLNEAAGQGNWSVDTQNPDKILTVTVSNDGTKEKIVKAVQNAGLR